MATPPVLQTACRRHVTVSDEPAALTYRQWVGDGSELDGNIEWPALLRGLDRTDASYRD